MHIIIYILLFLMLALLAGAAVWIARLCAQRALLQATVNAMGDAADNARQQSSLEVLKLLEPLRSQLTAFSAVVSEKYAREASERHALADKIDELRSISTTAAAESRRLSDVLRGNNRVQGQWGEMVLQNILEDAGLQEGREFFTQQSQGPLRPDVVVNMPGDGSVVIDSKTSLTAYMNYIEATDDAVRQTAARAHVASVRAHIDELHRKNYQDAIGRSRRLEFVLMFMPNEGAFLAAMQFEPSLWEEAYAKRVVIISPAHLLSMLRLIEQMWRHDAQDRNAMEIAREAGLMYDKFVGFCHDLDDVQKAADRAVDALAAARSKLATGRGNLTDRAEKLRQLGAKTSKRLPSSI